MAAVLADDIFNCIFLNENDRIPIHISLKYDHMSPIDNKPALVQVMAWRRTGDKPLTVPMMTQFMAHICGTRGRIVKWPIHTLKNHKLGRPIFIIIHYKDVIMSAMASQITSLTNVCFTVYSGADQRKHQSSPSLAFVRGIHQWPVNSPHKGQ